MDEIVEHVEKHIGPVHMTFREVVPGDPAVDILHVKSSRSRPYEVLVTSGMSARPMTVPDDVQEAYFAEILAILPKGWPLADSDLKDERNYWPIRLLKNLARHPHQRSTYLAWNHALPNGESDAVAKPYADGTALSAVALLPPALFDEETLWLTREDGHVVAFLAVVPLHLNELKYKNEHGMEALTGLLEEHDVAYEIDPLRPSVVA